MNADLLYHPSTVKCSHKNSPLQTQIRYNSSELKKILS